jgi:hypothetical protein
MIAGDLLHERELEESAIGVTPYPDVPLPLCHPGISYLDQVLILREADKQNQVSGLSWVHHQSYCQWT